MKNPLVSILIPAYNHEPYVAKCLNSILEQTYDNFEVIIVDDCSTDKTSDIITSFSDKRIKFVQNTFNRGMNGNINVAYKLSKGKYCSIISSDDYIEPNFLEKMVQYYLEHPEISILYPCIQKVNDNNEILGIDENPLLNLNRFELLQHLFFHGNGLASPGYMMSKKSCELIFPLDAGIQPHQDYIIHIQLLFQSNFGYVDTPILNYRVPTDTNNHISSDEKKAFHRIEIETPISLDYYIKNIKDVTTLSAIFGDKLNKYGTPQKDTIIYFLARLAIDCEENRLLPVWGIRTLIKYLNIDGNQQKLYDLYKFDYKDFSKLAGSIKLQDYYLDQMKNTYENSKCWKLTAPVRKILDFIKK